MRQKEHCIIEERILFFAEFGLFFQKIFHIQCAILCILLFIIIKNSANQRIRELQCNIKGEHSMGKEKEEHAAKIRQKAFIQ